MVVVAYVAAVGLIGAVLSPTGDLVVSLVVTGIVAVSFQPLRERVQRLVNRLMYGERDDPYAAIARLGRSLTSAVQLTRCCRPSSRRSARRWPCNTSGSSSVGGGR